MDRLISRCEVRQCSQTRPGVRVREKRRNRCYPVFTFFLYCFQQVFRVKKLVGRQWGAPNSNYLLAMGWPGTFVMPFSITVNASHAHIKQTHTCIHRHTQTCTDTPTHIIQTQTYTRTHTQHVLCVCVCTWQSTNLYMITPCNG